MEILFNEFGVLKNLINEVEKLFEDYVRFRGCLVMFVLLFLFLFLELIYLSSFFCFYRSLFLDIGRG